MGREEGRRDRRRRRRSPNSQAEREAGREEEPALFASHSVAQQQRPSADTGRSKLGSVSRDQLSLSRLCPLRPPPVGAQSLHATSCRRRPHLAASGRPRIGKELSARPRTRSSPRREASQSHLLSLSPLHCLPAQFGSHRPRPPSSRWRRPTQMRQPLRSSPEGLAGVTKTRTSTTLRPTHPRSRPFQSALRHPFASTLRARP